MGRRHIGQAVPLAPFKYHDLMQPLQKLCPHVSLEAEERRSE